MGRKKKDDIYPDIENEFAEFETEEEKKEKKKQKKAEEDDMDCLPGEGLYTPEGHLFYHENPYNLTNPQYKRAAEHGINLRKKIGFSIEESIQMFKNWKKFAEENKIKLEKAEEYVGAKKAQKHLLQHQEEFKFWPKLCDGLPHRAGYHVKQRAEFMLTEDFLKTLDWTNLEEEIRIKFYVYTDYTDEQMQKAKRLLDRGYVAGHVGELLGVSRQIASGMQKKLKAIEEREDPQMVQQFFDAAVTFGLDLDKLREYLETDDDVSYHFLDKNVKIKEMSLKIHMSPDRIHQFLKTWLNKIWNKYQEKKENDWMTDEQRYQEAMEMISSKPPLSTAQMLRGLEIFCQNIQRDEKSVDLIKRKDIARLLKKAGITGFMCHMPEFQYLYQKFCSHMPQTLEKWLFRHLRRSFRFRLKLHILLWTWKTGEWNKLKIGPDETRYEAVLRHETANPYVSKVTLKFLKDKDVAEWVMEPRLPLAGRYGAIRRRQIGIELFVLYCNQRYGSRFVFPVKLRPLLSKSAKQIRKILERNEKDSEDPDSEYVSVREVRDVVEKATNSKLVTGVSKWVMQKELLDSEEDSEGVDEEEDLEGLLTHVKAKENDWAEQREADIQELLDKADSAKRKRGFTSDSDEENGDVELTEEVRRERQALRQIEKRWRLKNKTKKFKSKEFVESSEDSDDSEGEKDSGDLEEVNSEGQEDSEDSDDFGSSEDVEKKRKKRKRNSEGQEDLEDSGARDSQDSGVPEDSEDLEVNKKSKKAKKQDSGALHEDSESLDVSKRSKKAKKAKKRDSQDSGDVEPSGALDFPYSQDSGVAGDSEDVQSSRKSKKRKNRDREVVEDSEGHEKRQKLQFEDSEVPEDSGDVEERKKKKKKKKRDSETILELEEEDSEAEKAKKKKKKKKEKFEN